MAGQVKGAAKVAARLEELFKGENGGVKGSEAEKRILDYYVDRNFYGAAFDDVDSSPNAFTEHDLLKLSLLSVPVTGSITRDLLGGFFDTELEQFSGKTLNGLLSEVPVGVAFEEVLGEDFKTILDKGSPADTLWKAIRKVSQERNWGMGQTRTAKLLAAKRPQLIPIYDSVIAKEFGRTSSRDHWTDMRDLFKENPELVKKLKEVSKAAGKDISAIRALDVILWMELPAVNREEDI